MAPKACHAAVALVVTMVLGPPSGAAELPPVIQIDRLLVQAEREARDGNHW